MRGVPEASRRIRKQIRETARGREREREYSPKQCTECTTGLAEVDASGPELVHIVFELGHVDIGCLGVQCKPFGSCELTLTRHTSSV